MFRLASIASLGLALTLTACAPSDATTSEDSSLVARTADGTPFAYDRIPLDTTRPPGTIIDSVFPMPEQMRRFRDGLPEIRGLVDAPTSRQALIEQFVAAVSTKDRAALGKLVLSRAEFAWIYYPTTSDYTEPNGLPPTLRWNQIYLTSEKGIGRVLDRMTDSLKLQRFDCPNPPVSTGASALHTDCTVHLTRADGSTYSGRLFGAILEYAGRFKFLSYANDM